MQGGCRFVPLLLEEQVAHGESNECCTDHGHEHANLQKHKKHEQGCKEGKPDQGIFQKGHYSSLAASGPEPLRPWNDRLDAMLLRVALAVAVLVIFVYGLVDVIRTDGRLARGISKPAWIVVMIVLPVVGAILWLLIGRPRGAGPGQTARRQPTAPDDDPDFLRNLEARRRKQAETERLKRLKDEAGGNMKGDGGQDTGKDQHDTDGLK